MLPVRDNQVRKAHLLMLWVLTNKKTFFLLRSKRKGVAEQLEDKSIKEQGSCNEAEIQKHI